VAQRLIFDITNSKEYFQTERDYYNGLVPNCVVLLDELLLLIEKTPVLKQLEYRYANLLVILRFIDVEFKYLDDITRSLRSTQGSNTRPVEFLMHLKNYLVHIDSFIDYLDGFLEVLKKDADINYRFDRKNIEEFRLINEIRNQIHHESLPTIDYNHHSFAPAHSDVAPRTEVHEIRLRWPLTKAEVNSSDLATLINSTKDAIKNVFERIINSVLCELKDLHF
jgi:hypothetical protein